MAQPRVLYEDGRPYTVPDSLEGRFTTDELLQMAADHDPGFNPLMFAATCKDVIAGAAARVPA